MADDVDEGLDKIRRSSYVSGHTKRSYADANPQEAARVFAYLDGGAEPTPFPVTLMGQGLTQVERGHRPPTHSQTYLFQDEFDVDGPPDPTKWWATPWCSTAGDDAEGCFNAANAYVSGGNLVLKVSSGTMGRKYDFARVQTFREGGWPPPSVLHQFDPPFRLEARIKFSGGAGYWGEFWCMANRDSANNLELDVQEFRGAHPTEIAVHTHIAKEYGNVTNVGFDGSADFHVYWMEYRTSGVTFGVDSITTGQTSLPSTPPQMIRLTNHIGVPGTWGGEGGPPPTSAVPGLMLVDYVRVWRI